MAWKSLLLTAIGVYGVFVGALWLGQRALLYFPDKQKPRPAAHGVPEMTEVRTPTDDGLDLGSWYKAAEPGQPTVVLFHGNAGHRGHRSFKARAFLDQGWGVFLAGYRGYGGNPGEPTERGLYADGRAALAFLKHKGVAAGSVVLYGESLGSGVAVKVAAEAATDSPVGALVLEAPYSSITDVAQSHYPFVPVGLLLKDRFDSVSRIGSIRAPLLVIHGENDGTVPIRFGRRLFEKAAEPKEGAWIPRAGHNNVWDAAGPGVVLAFVERHLQAVDK